MRKYLAEFVGTAILVIVGCGSAVVGGYGASGAVGLAAISLAFGFIVAGLVYALGPVSGCHINPAITLSVWVAGRMPAREVPGYIVAQMAGALAGAGLLVLLLSGRAKGYDVAVEGLGQTGWAANYLGGYSLASAFGAEGLATFILGLVVLATTRKDALPFKVADPTLRQPNLDRPGRNKAALAENEFEPVGRKPRLVGCDQAIDQFTLSLARARHVEPPGAKAQAECRDMANEFDNFRAVDQVLAGQAGNVGA
jgi:glycerol uptake facilitator-like aquaporin